MDQGRAAGPAPGELLSANTGMDFFGWRGQPVVGLDDVADVEGLTRALETARER